MPRRRPAPVGHAGPGGRQAARRGRGGDRKPFGTGLASVQDLNQILRIQLPEPVIFRVDHFLSDELVRRVIVLRFLNRVFEPTWNAVHVDHVDISWLESLTLEGRAS
jgi:glucose-6-phosphate 1-dehydrogenase